MVSSFPSLCLLMVATIAKLRAHGEGDQAHLPAMEAASFLLP
jgi:hypothetical protein